MTKFKTNNYVNRVSSKEELIELLKKYKGILNNEMIDYLNSLINLEFSVIRKNISENDRNVLSELEIYKKVSIYNVYNKALNLFKQSNENLRIRGNDEDINGLDIYFKSKKGTYSIFDFGYTSNYIGSISLFQTFCSDEIREAEMIRLLSELDRLYDEKNPYPSMPGVYGDPSSQWKFEHSQQIKSYERKYKQLDSKKELTDIEKQEIETTKKFHELLLEDYDLKTQDFEEIDNSLSEYDIDRSKLNKKLVKKISNITITDNIKYI